VQITNCIQRRKKMFNLNNQNPSQMNIFDLQNYSDFEKIDKVFVVSYDIDTNTISNAISIF